MELSHRFCFVSWFDRSRKFSYNHRWARLPKQQSSITVNRLTNEDKKLPFSVSVAANKCKFAFPFFVCTSKRKLPFSEAVVLDNCTELYLSENSSRLESDLDSSLTCGWQSYNSEQTSSYRQWCIPPSHRSSIFLRQMPLFSKINQESLSCSLYM